MLDSCKMVKKQSEAFHTFLWHNFFPTLKQNFITYRSSKVSDCIFEIHQLWQSGFSRVYSNSCCSCLFEPGIIKIGQSSYKMYSNNMLNFQQSTTILNAGTKKVWNLIECTTYLQDLALNNQQGLICLETQPTNSTVGWGCRIHRLHLYRGVIPTSYDCPVYDIKTSDGEAPALEI